MALPGTAAIPAVHADRLRAAEASGQQAVTPGGDAAYAEPDHHAALGRERAARAARHRRLHERHHPSHGGRRARSASRSRSSGSTRCREETPVLVDLKPTGQHYMSDLHAAGGIGAVLRELRADAAPRLPHRDRARRSASALGRGAAGSIATSCGRSPIPIAGRGGLVALFGTLAPNGAIIKRSAADPALFEREGRAVVFDLARRSRGAHRRRPIST